MTTTTDTITISTPNSMTFTMCKHRLPCGLCELKKTQCESPFTYPKYYEEDLTKPRTVSIYAAPERPPIMS